MIDKRDCAAAKACTDGCATVAQEGAAQFDFGQDYAYQEELHGLEGRPSGGLSSDGTRPVHYGPQWALLRFSQPVTAPKVTPAPVNMNSTSAGHAYQAAHCLRTCACSGTITASLSCTAGVAASTSAPAHVLLRYKSCCVGKTR